MDAAISTDIRELNERIHQESAFIDLLRLETSKAIVGQKYMIDRLLLGLLSQGHILLEGVPGLAKTLAIKTLASAIDAKFARIQFTPDLLPADLIGTMIYNQKDNNFSVRKGPIFANFILADEINRATPKTQSALLEAMEERQVTVLDETYKLPQPFFVLATQNPVELEGTYPLPEAQLDRFLNKVLVPAPTSDELKEILRRTTGNSIPDARNIIPIDKVAVVIENMKRLVRHVYVADPWQDVLVRMISALTPGNRYATEKVKKYLRFGPGPRGAQAIILSAKVAALLDGRMNLAFEDIKAVIVPALRHRLVLNFNAEADGVTSDQIIDEVRNAK